MMLRSLRFLEFGFFMIYCRVDLVHCSFHPPLMDTGENQTELNVTGYFNYYKGAEVVVVMENVTWYTAVQACRDLGYGRLDQARKDHMRTSLTAALLKETPGYGNISLWAGLYKPNVKVNEWFAVNYSLQCNFVEFPDFDEVNAEHQCAVNVYDVIGAVPSLRTRNCSTLLGFQCVKWNLDLSNYTQYDGYVVQAEPPRTATHVRSFNFTMCLDYCDSRAFCIGFTYNTTNGKCSSYHYNEFGEAFVNYSLTYKGGNVSHYTKMGMTGSFVEEVDSSLLQGNMSFECPTVSTTTGSSSTATSSMLSSTALSSYPPGSSTFRSSTMTSATSSDVSITSLASADLSSPSSVSGISISSTLSDTPSTATWSEWFTSGLSSTSKTSKETPSGPSTAVTSTENSILSTSPKPSVSLIPSDMSSSSTSVYVSQSSLSDTFRLSSSGSSTSVISETDVTRTSLILVKSSNTMSGATPSETSTVMTSPNSPSSSTTSGISKSSISDTSSAPTSPYTSDSSTVFETFASRISSETSALPILTDPLSTVTLQERFSTQSLSSPSSSSSSSSPSSCSSSSSSLSSSLSSTTKTKTTTTAASSSASTISSSSSSAEKSIATSSLSASASVSATSKASSSLTMSTSAALSSVALKPLPSSSSASSTVSSTASSPKVGTSTTSGTTCISTSPTGLCTSTSPDPTLLLTFANVSIESTSTAPSSLPMSHDWSSSTLSKLFSVYLNATSTSVTTPADASIIPQSSTPLLTTESFLLSILRTPLESSSISVSTDSSSTLISSEASATSTIVSTESESHITDISTELLTSTAQGVCGCKDYCPSQTIQNETELDDVVNVLVRNLTVNPRETNKYKQSLVCVEDDRVSSKAIAAISVSIVSILFGSIVVSDLGLLLNVLKQPRRLN